MYEIQPEYIGAWNPTPSNELEHAAEATERYHRQYQFHQNQAIKWREIFIDHFKRTGAAEQVIKKHSRQAAEYLQLHRIAKARLTDITGSATHG